MIRRIAVHRVIIGGKVIPMCVVGIENNGIVAFYESFSGEPPFTEWIGGTAILSYKSEMDFCLPLSCKDLMHELAQPQNGNSVYVWHVEADEWHSGMVHHLKRL